MEKISIFLILFLIALANLFAEDEFIGKWENKSGFQQFSTKFANYDTLCFSNDMKRVLVIRGDSLYKFELITGKILSKANIQNTFIKDKNYKISPDLKYIILADSFNLIAHPFTNDTLNFKLHSLNTDYNVLLVSNAYTINLYKIYDNYSGHTLTFNSYFVNVFNEVVTFFHNYSGTLHSKTNTNTVSYFNLDSNKITDRICNNQDAKEYYSAANDTRVYFSSSDTRTKYSNSPATISHNEGITYNHNNTYINVDGNSYSYEENTSTGDGPSNNIRPIKMLEDGNSFLAYKKGAYILYDLDTVGITYNSNFLSYNIITPYDTNNRHICYQIAIGTSIQFLKYNYLKNKLLGSYAILNTGGSFFILDSSTAFNYKNETGEFRLYNLNNYIVDHKYKFKILDTLIYKNSYVNFNISEPFGYTDFQIDFGDNKIENIKENGFNFKHRYENSGTYTIKLYSYNEMTNLPDTAIFKDAINVIDVPKVNINYELITINDSVILTLHTDSTITDMYIINLTKYNNGGIAVPHINDSLFTVNLPNILQEYLIIAGGKQYKLPIYRYICVRNDSSKYIKYMRIFECDIDSNLVVSEFKNNYIAYSHNGYVNRGLNYHYFNFLKNETNCIIEKDSNKAELVTSQSNNSSEVYTLNINDKFNIVYRATNLNPTSGGNNDIFQFDLINEQGNIINRKNIAPYSFDILNAPPIYCNLSKYSDTSFVVFFEKANKLMIYSINSFFPIDSIEFNTPRGKTYYDNEKSKLYITSQDSIYIYSLDKKYNIINTMTIAIAGKQNIPVKILQITKNKAIMYNQNINTNAYNSTIGSNKNYMLPVYIDFSNKTANLFEKNDMIIRDVAKFSDNRIIFVGSQNVVNGNLMIRIVDSNLTVIRDYSDDKLKGMFLYVKVNEDATLTLFGRTENNKLFTCQTQALDTTVSNIIENNIDIILFPNPADKTLTIADKVLKVRNPEIMDISGRIFKCSIISKSENAVTLDISHLPEGIYFLKPDNDNNLMKFIIKR